MKTFIFTCGDTNGIGPELVIKSLNKITPESKDKFVFVCPENIFTHQIKTVKPLFKFELVNTSNYSTGIPVSVITFSDSKYNPGVPTRSSGIAAYKSLEIAFAITHKSLYNSIITAPISKFALSLANINFPGQTEIFANWCETRNFVMMFLSKSMKAALMTIHQPIKKVPLLLSGKLFSSKLKVIIHSLKNDFNLKNPRIAILGLNPHAGESGLIGEEESNIVIPFMKNFSGKEYLFGPYSPDAFFGTKAYSKFDLVVGMYHDQILNPFKLLNFNKGVNFTAGLPIVRTSPDHGVAYDIAGKGIANESSMVEAYKYAKMILKNRIKNV